MPNKRFKHQDNQFINYCKNTTNKSKKIHFHKYLYTACFCSVWISSLTGHLQKWDSNDSVQPVRKQNFCGGSFCSISAHTMSRLPRLLMTTSLARQPWNVPNMKRLMNTSSNARSAAPSSPLRLPGKVRKNIFMHINFILLFGRCPIQSDLR